MAIPDNKAAKQKKKENKKAADGKKIVIDGAIIKCDSCVVPIGKMKVNFNTPTIQNKKVATIMEKNATSLQFSGNCMKSPKMEIPCKAFMSLTKWEKVGDMKVQDKPPLLQESTIKCIKGGTVTIVDSGQLNVPSTIQVKGVTTTRVQKIELKTPLDDGSLNDGTGTGTQKGFVFGKTYTFKVKSYTDKDPVDKNSIKWMYKYHNSSQNKWIEVFSKKTGEEYSIYFNEEEMCGRFVYLRAYINDAKNEGELKVWKHNRFRWFDSKIVNTQIDERVKEPWRIDQGSSSLCGMAALYYAMIKRDASAYKKLAKELFRTGEYKIKNYIIKPHKDALSMYEMKKSNPSYKAMKMFEIDWIVMATTRSKESSNEYLVYKGTESGKIDMLKAVNWPDLLTRMCKEVAGFGTAIAHDLGYNAINNKKRLVSARIHDHFSNSDLEELQKIDASHEKGHQNLMMIDADMISDKSSYNSFVDIANDSHWVVYAGGLQFFDKSGKETTVLKEVETLSFTFIVLGVLNKE